MSVFQDTEYLQLQNAMARASSHTWPDWKKLHNRMVEIDPNAPLLARINARLRTQPWTA